jgi:hypothetical protein
MAHDLDEPGDALTKIHTWFVPREGGVRHFTFTLETKLFHFPEAQPDCWYITSIDHCDPIALRRAREQQQKEQREQEKRRKHHPPNRPTPPADDKPP